jgi:hypothetical protein
MEKKAIIMVGKKSSPHSVFAVFEHFNDWTTLRENKVIPDGFYFAVILSQSKTKVDIFPNLFVQGYRPHSSGAQIHVDKRRYDKFVPDNGMRVTEDDIAFEQVQLYKVIDGRKVELIFTNGESRIESVVQSLADRICQDGNFEKLGSVKRYRYHCPIAAGYFLACRSYDVWSILVGKSNGFSLEKKVLIIDYLTGIPAIVPYDDRHFEAVLSEKTELLNENRA